MKEIMLMRRITALATVVALIALTNTADAQTVSTTTLSADATSTALSFTVASATGIVPGYLLVVDRETAVVATVSGSTVSVNRGAGGLQGAHFSGALVYFGPRGSFQTTDVSSPSCQPSGSPTPYINYLNTKAWVCNGLGLWVDITGATLPTGTVLVGTGAATASGASSAPPISVATFGNGSAAAPSVAFTNDTSTGLYRVGASDLGITAGGIKQVDVSGTAAAFTADVSVGGNTSLAGHLTFSADNTKDVGASGATRPRDLFLGRNALIGGTLGVTGTSSLAATALTGNLTFTNDNTNDIGSSAATRPRDLFLGRNALVGGTFGVTGVSSLAATALTGHLTFTNDNTNDIGASGATRPRNIFVAGTVVVGTVAGSAATQLQLNVDGKAKITNNAGTSSLSVQSAGTPTCSSNCGTSPSISGSDTAMTVTMGATGSPASGWVVTFAGTWAAAPACMVSTALNTMSGAKIAGTITTTTTTVTVTTSGSAPSNSDKYHVLCFGTQ